MHKIYQYNKTDEWKDKTYFCPQDIGSYLKTTKSIKDHNNGLIEATQTDPIGLVKDLIVTVTSTTSLIWENLSRVLSVT